jgi:hypothetical protein
MGEKVKDTTILIVASVSWLAACGASMANPTDLPGVWRELEQGGWHTAAKGSHGASGGKRVSWFDQKGRAVYIELDVTQAMPKALVFLRYSGGSGKPLDVSLAPLGADGQPGAAKSLGQMTLTGTGNDEKYTWASLPAGDLATGKYRLVFSLSEPGGADLDVAGIVTDRHQGLWAPPNQVVNGKLVGACSVAVAYPASSRTWSPRNRVCSGTRRASPPRARKSNAGMPRASGSWARSTTI